MIDPAQSFVAIGVDVGGTKIAAGTVQFPGGQVLERREIRTRLEHRGASALHDCTQLVAGLASQSKLPVRAIGLGICEIVDPHGEIASAHCLQWTSADLLQAFASIAPTRIEADVRAAALAEAWHGAGRNVPLFLYVSVGTGISCSLVIDGEPFKGLRGAAGTMASGAIPGFGITYLSNICLEDVASGPAIVKRFNSLGGHAEKAQDVIAAAMAYSTPTDPPQPEPEASMGTARWLANAANSVIDSGAQALGGAIGWLVNVLDPDRVILGGSLGLNQGIYRDSLVKAMRQHIWWDGHRDIPVLSAALGRDAGLIGAALAAARNSDALPPVVLSHT
jgi:glucokinase